MTGVRECAAGRAACGNVFDVGDFFERDVSGYFDEGFVADAFTGIDHFVVRHVVEHDDVGAGKECLIDFVLVGDFDFDFERVWCEIAAFLYGFLDGAGGRDVVVFDHDAATQVESVAVAAAASYGVVLQFAEAG